MNARTILLNPGPVTLTERVRRSMLQADMCHREPGFAHLMREILEGIEAVYPDSKADYRAVLLTGSGTAAVEAMLQTFAPEDRATLVVANGVYGERMATILEAMRRPCVLVQAAWEEGPDMAGATRVLAERDDIGALAVVHHETTTGRLNAVGGLAELAHSRGLDLLIDAVSSFGGEWIDFAGWRPAAVAASSNKCLHGVPGLAFVQARQDLLERDGGAARSLYLDLRRYYRVQGDGFSPFTQAVQAAYALREALAEFAENGGLEARMARYAQLAERVRNGLAALGIGTLLAADSHSRILTSYRLPAGWSYAQLHDLLAAHDFVIYDAQGRLQGHLFRIANMGDLRDADIERLLGIFAREVAGGMRG